MYWKLMNKFADRAELPEQCFLLPNLQHCAILEVCGIRLEWSAPSWRRTIYNKY